MIHKWSIEHPYMVISFFLGMIITAVLTIGFYMPRRFMPYVESPMVGVVTMMPGLSSQEMEMYVSKPIEEQLVNVKNLHYIRSTSQDGFSIVSLEFNYGTDMKKALFDVQSLMNVVQANLPATGANIKPSWVLAIDPLNLPILSLSVTGDERWDKTMLREFVDNDVVNRLKTIPDDYSVVPFGGYRRQLQVVVDRQKLAAYGLSILDVRNAIDRFNVSRPGGTITSGSSEEIVRFRAHLAHWAALGASEEPCGRKLDFLLQEMNREVNTIGSKADGLAVSELIVNAKAELKKMREQVQNVE
jgi:HAE1 family hydrophobic/amphiphilic exporter-1